SMRLSDSARPAEASAATLARANRSPRPISVTTSINSDRLWSSVCCCAYAVAVLCDQREIVFGVDLHRRAEVALGDALGKFRELLYRLQNAASQQDHK